MSVRHPKVTGTKRADVALFGDEEAKKYGLHPRRTGRAGRGKKRSYPDDRDDNFPAAVKNRSWKRYRLFQRRKGK